jgi:hypothetical protein
MGFSLLLPSSHVKLTSGYYRRTDRGRAGTEEGPRRRPPLLFFVVAIPGQGARRMPYCLVRGGDGREEEEVGVRIFYKQRGRSRGAPSTTST